MEIKVVGVIGAGVMGGGLAQNLAQTGTHVLLIDISEKVLQSVPKEAGVYHTLADRYLKWLAEQNKKGKAKI